MTLENTEMTGMTTYRSTRRAAGRLARNRLTAGIMALGSLFLSACAALEMPADDTARTPQLEQGFGAIAFSSATLRWHMRWNVATEDRASIVAIQQCGADDCEVILTFGPGQCGTFSLGDGNALAVGMGSSEAVARDLAFKNCSLSGQNCKVAPVQCNTLSGS